jgi:hypothetical protein
VFLARADYFQGDYMLGAIDQALSGIRAGYDRLDGAATRIARDGAAGDLSGNLVTLLQAKDDVRANTAVIRTVNETIGSLFDAFA